MISSQDKYLAGVVSGDQPVTRDQFDCCLREGLLSKEVKAEPGIEGECKAVNRQAVATELAHQRIVTELLDNLGNAGIDCLVFKGTALAYSLYEQPWHRSRGDTDLWFRETDVDAAFALLERLGFERQVSLPGRLAFGECAFNRIDEFGLTHSIDLHWRLNSNWMLANAAGFEELWQDRVSLPRLGAHAWTCNHSFALLIACVHRGAHLRDLAYEVGSFGRFESDFTLWIYDIHLLSGAMTGKDWMHWSGRVIDRGFAEFAVSGLERSMQLFGTRVPEWLIPGLQEATGQISMRPLDSQISAEWQSFRALGGFRKLGFIKQQLFPAASYMRDRYEGWPLPVAYVKRLLVGLIKRVG